MSHDGAASRGPLEAATVRAGRGPRRRRGGVARAAAVLGSLASGVSGLAGAGLGVFALGALVATTGRAEEPADPARRAAVGDANAVIASLVSGYRAGTLDPWTARLYQDLRMEATDRATVRKEAEAAFPEPRTPMGAWLVARVAERKDLETALGRCAGAVPEPATVPLDLGWNALQLDRAPAAAVQLARAKKLAADREETALLDAAVFRAQGRLDAAAKTLATYVATHPDALDARRAWADVLLAAHRRADAAAVLDEGLRAGRAAPLLVARAALLLGLRDAAGVKAALDEAKDLGRPALRAEAGALRCALLLAGRDLTGASAAADAALAVSPTHVGALRAKARCLELQGMATAALSTLDVALEERPGLACLYADKGAVYLRARQLKDARKALAEAKRRDADDPGVALLVGAMAEEDGDWSVAERVYRGILRDDPEHADARRLLAGVLILLGRLEAADSEAAGLLGRDAKDPAAWFVRGYVALRQDRWDDAIAAFDQALAADAAYALAHCGKGWVFEQQDKLDDAKKAFEAGVAADPKLPLPHRELAELLEELSDPGVALKHYRLYLELGGADPDEDVRHAVDRLAR